MECPSEQMRSAKRALRARLRTRLARMDPERLRIGSREAAERLVGSDEFRRASAVMIFLPLRFEVDARLVALRAWQEGKTVTVPLVGRAHRHMLPVVVRSLEEPMDADHYGVQSPASAEPFPVEMLDLVVVPGLGFDREGRRLGRGGGFYDRFLSQATLAARTCGMALAEQVVDLIPSEPHDVPLDMLATDAQLLRFADSPMMERS